MLQDHFPHGMDNLPTGNDALHGPRHLFSGVHALWGDGNTLSSVLLAYQASLVEGIHKVGGDDGGRRIRVGRTGIAIGQAHAPSGFGGGAGIGVSNHSSSSHKQGIITKFVTSYDFPSTIKLEF